MIYIVVLLCLGAGVGVADGAGDGTTTGDCVGSGMGELPGLATADGATIGEIEISAPLEKLTPFVPSADATAENAGFKTKIAETTPAAIACGRMTEPPPYSCVRNNVSGGLRTSHKQSAIMPIAEVVILRSVPGSPEPSRKEA